LSEFVEGGLKQRESQVRQREIEGIKRERQVRDEEEIEIAMDERRLEEDERRMLRLKDELTKNKA
jgi:hypothetical protein